MSAPAGLVTAHPGAATELDPSAGGSSSVPSPTEVDLLERIRPRLVEGLEAALRAEYEDGMPRPRLHGQLIRPTLSYAAATLQGETALDPRFWCGALAVQLAHEASLLHDDVVDGAATRRGEPTVATVAGVGRAVVEGDHLLTTAYRLAAATGSPQFTALFARCVERTVAGELAQGRLAGQRLDFDRYEQVVAGKSGELLGCALATAPLLAGRTDAGEFYVLGQRIGVLYQMLDDLLDYCPSAGTGKPPLADYNQRRWTWVLSEAPHIEFGRDPADLLRALHETSPGSTGSSAMHRCLVRWERELAVVESACHSLLPGVEVLSSLLASWRERARGAVAHEEAARQQAARVQVPAPISPAILERVPSAGAWNEYFAHHSRSFRFASRFFPREEGDRVARVYAYCRVTDDLVDRVDGRPEETVLELLEEWVERSRDAYRGRATGIDLLDQAMSEMAAADVPFAYAEELVEGMRMDLRHREYSTLADLSVYTYRVASVVGLWITELFGVHDARVLQDAAAMGRAMQLTNILRDVGEDWQRGRLYLPLETLHSYGLTPADVGALYRGEREIGPEYAAMLEELMRSAEEEYRGAFPSIARLPVFLQRPVAVAAHVYRGIHGEIRRNGYDNLRRRAHTSPGTKLVLAARALWDLWHAGHFSRIASVPAPLPDVQPLLGERRFAAPSASTLHS